MPSLSRILAGCILVVVPAFAQPRREAIEWTDVWMPHTNDRDLPRVLLIGDSITRGYYPMVEEKLKGKAYVSRITTSKAIGDPALLAELAVFIAQQKFAVVHFNIGMHGWDYTEEEYRRGFPALVKTTRKHAPGARLICATTTPIRKDSERGGATNARIEARNDIVKSAGLPVDDLHALMQPRTEMHTDDVHFTKEGSSLMAAQVAGMIEKQLNGK